MKTRSGRMSKNQAVDVIHNGWRKFNGQETQRWTADTVFWAFRSSDRAVLPILYVEGAFYPWKLASLNGASLDLCDADYILPFSACTPPLPDQPVFHNPLPVVVMLVLSNRGLIVIRRALKDGYGKLAMPGGFHNLGETWQEAGCREFFEETGIEIDPAKVKIYDVVTVQNGKVNLIFGVYDGIVIDPMFEPDAEIMEVLELDAPVETAFPAHTEIMARYFEAIGKDDCGMQFVAR
jgi:8-oxo-dGTP pyrophosphatase MutT (NUDIX family)